MSTTIFDKHGNALTIDGATATLNGQPITTKVNPRANSNGTSVYVNHNGSIVSFSNLSVEQANAVNDYNAQRTARKATSGNTRTIRGFVHSTDYASVEEMLNDTLAPIEVVKMRSIVDARKVSKDLFLREATAKLEQAQKEFDELQTAWDTANTIDDNELNTQLEQLRQDCNKQFAIDRIAKLNKNDLQAMLLELLSK